MSKVRMINTKFWSDAYIISLTIEQKLLYLYLITNSSVEPCGVYEITIPRIIFETGLKDVTIRNAFERFQTDNKIFFFGDYVYIKNFVKNQKMNPNMMKGVERTLLELPDEIRAEISKIDEGLRTVPNHSPLNLNLNLNLNKEGVKKFTPPTYDEVKKYCDERNNGINAQQFIDYYATANWMRGNNKIKDWKACVRTWEQRQTPNKQFISKEDEAIQRLKQKYATQ